MSSEHSHSLAEGKYGIDLSDFPTMIDVGAGLLNNEVPQSLIDEAKEDNPLVRVLSRATKRTIMQPNRSDVMLKIAFKAAAIIRKYPEAERTQSAHRIFANITPSIGGIPASLGEMQTQAMADLSMEIVETITLFEEVSAAFTEKIEAEIRDEEQQYAFLQNLTAGATSTKNDSSEQKVTWSFCIFDSIHSERPGFIDGIEGKLISGAFDTFIAHNLLQDAIGESTGLDNGSERQHSQLKQLIKLVEAVTGKETEEVVSLLSTEQMLAAWPELQASFIHNARHNLPLY